MEFYVVDHNTAFHKVLVVVKRKQGRKQQGMSDLQRLKDGLAKCSHFLAETRKDIRGYLRPSTISSTNQSGAHGDHSCLFHTVVAATSEVYDEERTRGLTRPKSI